MARANLSIMENNEDGFINLNGFRDRRLINFLRHLENRANGITENIIRVEDHEGSLSVWWDITPSDYDMIVVHQSWQDCGEDHIYEHYDLNGIVDRWYELEIEARKRYRTQTDSINDFIKDMK